MEYDEKTDKGRGSNSCALPFFLVKEFGCIPRHLDPRDFVHICTISMTFTAVTGFSSEANHDDSSYSTTPPGCSFWDDKFNASRNKVPVISILCCFFFGGYWKENLKSWRKLEVPTKTSIFVDSGCSSGCYHQLYLNRHEYFGHPLSTNYFLVPCFHCCSWFKGTQIRD